MRDNPGRPIVPADFDSWIYLKHNVDDIGERPPGWWKHNENFSIVPKDGRLEVDFEIGNSGWANAPMVQVEFFVPVGDVWQVLHDESQSLAIPSGKTRHVHYVFTPSPTYENSEIARGIFAPDIAIRVTTITSKAPSRAEIASCLNLFNDDPAEAIKRLRIWKQSPGFFVYPCCGLFGGLPPA